MYETLLFGIIVLLITRRWLIPPEVPADFSHVTCTFVDGDAGLVHWPK